MFVHIDVRVLSYRAPANRQPHLQMDFAVHSTLRRVKLWDTQTCAQEVYIRCNDLRRSGCKPREDSRGDAAMLTEGDRAQDLSPHSQPELSLPVSAAAAQAHARTSLLLRLLPCASPRACHPPARAHEHHTTATTTRRCDPMGSLEPWPSPPPTRSACSTTPRTPPASRRRASTARPSARSPRWATAAATMARRSAAR